MEVCCETRLGKWLENGGGHFHRDLYFKTTESHGKAVFTSAPIESNIELVSCPFGLSVHSENSRKNLLSLGFSSESLKKFNHHQILSIYIILHLIFPNLQSHLHHHVYISSLPSMEQMMTPPWWTDAEKELLKGTNLGVSSEVRTLDWRREYQDVVASLRSMEGSNLQLDRQVLLDKFSWQLYLYAGTILSSRSFPASLIPDLSEISTPSSQVLFPGVDTLNHHRATPITWSLSASSITLIPSGNVTIPADSQVFNTYGPKSTDSFILGYGFVPCPHTTQDDLLSLQVPLPHPSLKAVLRVLEFDEDNPNRFLLGISGELPKNLLILLRLLLVVREDISMEDQEEEEKKVKEWTRHLSTKDRPELTFISWYNELEMLDVLEEMLMAKFKCLENAKIKVEQAEGSDVRQQVKEMLLFYLQGQMQIVQNAIENTLKRIKETKKAAQHAGFDLDDEEDEHEEMDSSGSGSV